MRIRSARQYDRTAVLAVETVAFATPAEAELVAALLADPKARPTVSLLAEAHGVAVGHILLTGARVSGDGATVAASILAPLAVVPEAPRCRPGADPRGDRGADGAGRWARLRARATIPTSTIRLWILPFSGDFGP